MHSLRIHIGHHFFGAGNLGDDLMLAGFLAYAEERGWLAETELTCCSPHNLTSQRLRFPAVEWLPYDDQSRVACIARSGAWLGLGDTPFQISVGPWFLDHLCQEAAWCQQASVPMFFLGIGVNEAAALDMAQAHRALGAAERIWTRDAVSAGLLRDCMTIAPWKVSAAADLAHLALARFDFPAPAADETGLILNFEDPGQFKIETLGTLVDGIVLSSRLPMWLAQEARPLPGSELALHAELPPAARAGARVLAPDYAGAATTEALLAAWGVPGRLLTSRYHGALIGAWMGAATVVFARCAKVAAGAQQLGLPLLDDLSDPASILAALATAQPADRVLLQACANLARGACDEFFAATARLGQRAMPVPRPLVAPTARLASVSELESAPYRDLMRRINGFATSADLRTFTDWSKVWEYPWLWFHGLRDFDWSGRRLVDLSSEISPMPWLLACAGARVTLIETDPQWLPRWETLRAQLHVEVDWHLVDSERLPLPDASVDVLTSFSVIEHQPDKAAAVAEVARVLKPGGLLAISYDICEPEMGMTFPTWNGRALTLREFEEHVWLHPAFGQMQRPTWNLEDAPEFMRWHLRSAPHHQYIVGAAVLQKRASPQN